MLPADGDWEKDKQEPLIRPKVVGGCVGGIIAAYALFLLIGWIVSNLTTTKTGTEATPAIVWPVSAAQGWLILAGIWSIAVLLAYDVFKRHGVRSVVVKASLAIFAFFEAASLLLGLVRLITG
jgi:hypothetical protein